MISQTIQVNKRLKEEPNTRHAEFLYDFPESVQESLEKFGEDLTLRLIHDSITLILQGPARKTLEASPSNLSDEEYSSLVSNKMSNFQINARRTRDGSSPKSRLSPYQALLANLMDPDKRADTMEKFRRLGINLEFSEPAQSAGSENSTKEQAIEAGRRRR